MKRNKARELARTLMNKHGIGGMDFEFDRGKRRVASCRFMRVGGATHPTKITLSGHWTDAMDEHEIRDAILHEIAHALAGFEVGHGIQWRVIARSIGCNAMRCAAPSADSQKRMNERTPSLWTGTCSKGHTVQFYRAPGRVRSCTKCHIGFSRNHLIVNWTKGGRSVSITEFPQKYQAEMFRLTAFN